MWNSIKKFAFTLAEVLIVIGIIGIIAEVTIPTLIANFQKSQTISQLQVIYATLNTALDSAKVEYGTDVNSWYIPNTTTAAASTYFAQTYLLPYIKTTDNCGTSTSAACIHQVQYLGVPSSYYNISGLSYMYSFTLLNGAIVNVAVANLTGTTIADCSVLLYFDANGRKSPNIMGKDAFLVSLGGRYGTVGDRNKFFPYGLVGSSRSSLMDTSDAVRCNKISGSGAMCFALIMTDGFKISDDYPW